MFPQVAGSVGARVVDDEQFVRRTRLCEQGMEARRKVGSFIVGADDHAHAESPRAMCPVAGDARAHVPSVCGGGVAGTCRQMHGHLNSRAVTRSASPEPAAESGWEPNASRRASRRQRLNGRPDALVLHGGVPSRRSALRAQAGGSSVYTCISARESARSGVP